jgi:hypothetical protein
VSPQPEPSPGRKASGVLLLYNRPALFRDASTITDHIEAFGRYSAFDVHEVNTDGGFPKTLASLSFDAIVLHYSVFASGPHPYLIGEPFLEYLASATDSYKVAFFQDEHEYCVRRFEFLDRYSVDCVYTCFQPEHFEATYGTYTRVPKLVSHVPAYVSPGMVESANRLCKPDAQRSIDVGYRTRPTPPYFGRGGMEKVEIGERFAERAAGSGLALDISAREEDRLYGEDWYRFTAECRGVLGTESGVSCSDLEDEVRTEYLELSKGGRIVTIEDLEKGSLARWDWKVPLRTTSARHFEAAAMRVCQVMYEGEYSGVLKPMVHYIPLKKDISDFDEALARFRDPAVRAEITENAHRDLIASGHHSYERFIAGFDGTLREAGLSPDSGTPPAPAIRGRPATGLVYRYVAGSSLWLRHCAPRLWKLIWNVSRPPLNLLRRIRG